MTWLNEESQFYKYDSLRVCNFRKDFFLKTNKNKQLLNYILLLTAVLFIGQEIFLVSEQGPNVILAATLHTVFKIPVSIWFMVAWYWGLQIVLYAGFAVLIWWTGVLSSQYAKLPERYFFKWGFGLWFCGAIILFFANEIYYPLSVFGQLFFSLFPLWLARAVLIVALIPCVIAVVLAGLRVLQWLRLYHKIGWLVFIGLGVVIIGTVSEAMHERAAQVAPVVPRQWPNIFIIGLDAVRPDRLNYYGYTKNATPAIDRFLKGSTNFSFSLTPIARTYPAWVSILTGQYPKHHHIRFTLTNPAGMDFSHTSLAAILKTYGYKTVFATDGRRFNNLGVEFGFDQQIGPSGTVRNFIMYLVDNLPLIDLISNTRLGEWLYPDIPGNRDEVATYDPKTFISLLEAQLPPNSVQPIFAGIHLNLAHYPYEWAESPLDADTLSYSPLYDTAIPRLDEQFNQLMTYLQTHHYLDNAIVVVMSDHGDAFGIAGDRLIATAGFVRGKQSATDIVDKLNALQPGNKMLNTSAGHGTDVLSTAQYRNLLAFQLLGFASGTPATISAPVSLIDIKPTILSLLKIPNQQSDGLSLVPYLQGKTLSFKSPRSIFVELDFTPLGIRSTDISMPNVVLQSADVFEIDPTTEKVMLKPEMIAQLLPTKQKAVYAGDWILALYPYGRENKLFPVLVNKKTGQWTDDLTTRFAQRSSAKQLLRELKIFYGSEVTEYLKT